MVPFAGVLAAGWALLLATLTALTASTGLTALGWGASLACGVLTTTAVRRGPVAVGPADVVTVVRGALACALAAPVADVLLLGRPASAALLILAGTSLALDAVDGPVARRTGTVSDFGARLDGEADAFWLLVTSAYVADTVTPWALAIGLARYLFGGAGLLLPWLRSRLPLRYWRKVVTATQGIVLLVAAAGILPLPLTFAALAAAVALLAESFGRDVLWLWRRRHAVSSARPRALADPAGHEGSGT